MNRATAPVVARVLLVAHPARQEELASWLRVEETDEARYELRVCTPETLAAEPACDVIVIDGESLPREPSRFALTLVHQAGHRPRDASVVYVCSRLPSEQELDLARTWADDYVYAGWAQADRVRRRVQLVALAPWRRSRALRRYAETLGNARLRVLPSTPEPATETASDAAGQARRAAVNDLSGRLDRLCQSLLEEVESGRRCPEAIESIETAYRGARSPVVAARFDGASAAVEAVWGTLRQLLREELAAIDEGAVQR